MTADYLPQEILLDIFHRLPVKSICSCLCVSKYWLSIIKTPHFVSTHFKNQQQQQQSSSLSSSSSSSSTPPPPPLFLVRLCLRSSLEIRYSLRHDDHNLTRYSKIKPPSQFHNHSFSIVGSSRGLVCLMHNLYTCNYTIALWNPSIAKAFTLPVPRITFDTHGAFEALLGFGFDSFTQDYKVVRIVRLLERDEIAIEVEVFSLAAESWKRIRPKPPQYNIVERGSQALVNGTVHWVATAPGGDGGGRDKNLIMGFHLGEEQFIELDLPASLESECPIFLTVIPFRESSTIAVLRRNYLRGSDNEIWVMEEYGWGESWVRLFAVGMYGNGLPRTLGFRRNGDVLLELSNGEIVSGDPVSFRVRGLKLQGEVGYSVVTDFQETLVLLDR